MGQRSMCEADELCTRRQTAPFCHVGFVDGIRGLPYKPVLKWGWQGYYNHQHDKHSKHPDHDSRGTLAAQFTVREHGRGTAARFSGMCPKRISKDVAQCSFFLTSWCSGYDNNQYDERKHECANKHNCVWDAQALGRALLAHVTDWAAALGQTSLCIWSDPSVHPWFL